jgi:transcription elongation factor GreA
MSESIPMTRAGYNKIKAEVEHLDGVVMPDIAEKIAAARAEGDLKENAEYHAQRETQGQTQAKINLLRDKLSRAMIYDPSNSPKDQVSFGATVTVLDMKYDDEEVYTLVGAGEEDYDTGKILLTSPMGQSLLGKKLGEIAELQAPKGTIQLKIVSIKYEE